MDVKKLMLLIGALVVAAITAVMAKNMFSGASAPTARATPVLQQQANGPEVLVSTRTLPVGTIIDAGAFRYQQWPDKLTQPAYYIKGQTPGGPQDLVGTVVRNEIAAGAPITQGSLVKPGERGFLAAALGPGMRAITVPVSVTSGVAGFVFPGDRVDMVLTQEVGGGDGPPLKASETIIRNIRVLATDQRMSAQGDDGKPQVRNFSTVTLEATPKIAEKIAVAQQIGQLSLSLRSIADNNVDLQRAIAAGDVKVPAGTDPKAAQQMLIDVASQPIDTTPTYTVGAEVSRFQRSTVPTKAPAPGAGPASAPSGGAPSEAPKGPVVRVARGNVITIVPMGAK
ncbi:MAG TPA: Flp pilus assembly protein CpaB [Allosphingosinicella sp.]|jgi:pilus assembly protein CpaB